MGVWRYCILFMFFSFCVFSGKAQNFSTSYSPIREYRPSQKLLKKVYSGYDSIYNVIASSGRGEKKEIREALKGSKEYLMRLDTANKLMYGDTITKYLQSITNKIMQKNNGFVKDRRFTVFTYRTEEPNASNMGNGVVFFNLDLLSKMDNETEIAYILAHEMSHDIMGHVMSSIQRRYEIINSPEFKKEVRKIKNQEYNKFKAIEALVTKFLSKYTKDGRTQELEADSLGLILFYNAGYSPYVAIRAEEKLDSVDYHPVLMNKVDYGKIFNFPSFPFNKSWLEAEDEETISGGNVATYEEFPDSLKTHPDCKMRVAALKRIIARMNYNMRQPVKNDKGIDFYKMKSYFEMLEYCQFEYDLGSAFYATVELLRLYPENTYLKCSMVNCLFEITKAKEDHYFSQIADFPDKRYCSSYNECLTFLHNANSEIIKTEMNNYYHTYVEGKINNPFSGYLETLIKSESMQKKDREKLIGEYQSKYNDPYYTASLQDKFKPKHK